jgi:hypothetical protein
VRTYAVRRGIVNDAAIALFEAMCAEVRDLPDFDPVERISCHVVAHALASIHHGCEAVDGWFNGRGNEHSWLRIGPDIVADMYPIAGVNPFMIVVDGGVNPWEGIYRPVPGLLSKRDISADVEMVRSSIMSRTGEAN